VSTHSKRGLPGVVRALQSVDELHQTLCLLKRIAWDTKERWVLGCVSSDFRPQYFDSPLSLHQMPNQPAERAENPIQLTMSRVRQRLTACQPKGVGARYLGTCWSLS
jgi:hypothetical protein